MLQVKNFAAPIITNIFFADRTLFKGEDISVVYFVQVVPLELASTDTLLFPAVTYKLFP
jgi:hypothetical protein